MKISMTWSIYQVAKIRLAPSVLQNQREGSRFDGNSSCAFQKMRICVSKLLSDWEKGEMSLSSSLRLTFDVRSLS